MYNSCNFQPEKCDVCCFEFIKNSKLLPHKVINNWLFLHTKYTSMLKNLEENSSLNTKLYIISLYILAPSIFLSSIRVLFLEYFKRVGINEQALIRGKWLPTNININKKLIEHLFLTQNIRFQSESSYFIALDYFTSDTHILHRNKVAHDANESLQHASGITLKDAYFRFSTLAHCIVCFEDYINTISHFKRKTYRIFRRRICRRRYLQN